MKKLAAALVLLCASCATAPVGPMNIPPGSLDMGGEWRTAPIASVLRQFQNAAQSRYRPGLALNAASGDLAREGFRCSANADRRGDPPDQICRKTVTFQNCTHTWQVHLYDATPAATGGALGAYAGAL